MALRKWKHGTDCAYCLWNHFRGHNWPGHIGYRNAKKQAMWVAEIKQMKKPVSVGVGGPDLPKGGESLIATIYPALWEFLTDGKWDDGTARELPTLLLFQESGTWKLCVSDKSLDRVSFIAGHTPDDCLESLAMRLESDSVEWRAKKPWTPGKKKS